jgi:hypothetical protein
MSEQYDNRTPEQIQRDIDHTRAEMSETIETIRHKMSPGELFDQALEYFKTSGPSQFTSNLGDTAKNNPIPVTLIGLGIGWLMVSGSRDSHTAPTRNMSGGIGQRVSTASSGVADRAGQMMQGARERSGETRERMGEAVQSARYRVGDATDRVRHQVSSQSARAKDTFTYLRDEQPLILGVLGFALGAALGAGLPATRREDELMGDMRDETLHRAREAGKEQLEKAQHVAIAASEAAQEQANQEGLQPQREESLR